jgi:hypothetical protein
MQRKRFHEIKLGFAEERRQATIAYKVANNNRKRNHGLELQLNPFCKHLQINSYIKFVLPKSMHEHVLLS